MLSPKPVECQGCSLLDIGEGFIQPEGTGAIPLLAVGESPGWHEANDSLPFRPQAQAGSQLQRTLYRSKIDRTHIALWNMIACRPPADHLGGAYYEYPAINHCRVHFDKVINKYQPKVILAQGALPFKHLTGMEGYKLNISSVRGYVFKCVRYPDILVIPTYHPSFIMRGNQHLSGVYMQDWIKAKWLAQGVLKEEVDYLLNPTEYYSNKEYNTNPNLEDAKYFLQRVLENPELRIAYDIETDKSAGEEEDELEETGSYITQIQFSLNSGSGIAFPFNSDFIPIAKSILATSNDKCGHNVWDFDNPYLMREHFEINGRIDDTMWMCHQFQADLPIGLQYQASFFGFKFPWKHMSGSNLPFYGIADVASVQLIMKELPPKMIQRTMWNCYEKYVLNFKPILIEIGNRGLPINSKKLEDFEKQIDARAEEVLAEIKQHVPDSLERFNKKDGYVRIPKEVEQAKLNYYLAKGKMEGEVPEEYIKETTGYVLREFTVVDKPKKLTKLQLALQAQGVAFQVPTAETSTKVETRYVKLVDFNPNSSDQISDYIKSLGHEELARKLTVNIKRELEQEPGTKKEKDNVSTAAKLLQKLAEKTGMKSYKSIVEYKEIKKMKGTYIKGYRKFMDNEGRVHTTLGFRPASGQLNSKDPNVQNYPVHATLAKGFKECIEAPEGYVFVKLDYRGFFNKMMGFLSQDPTYLRVACLDTHSYVTGYVVNYPGMSSCLDLNDNELAIFLEGIKAIPAYKILRDNQVKRTVHGINNGLSPDGCFKRFADDFCPSAEEVLKTCRKEPTPEKLVKLVEQAGKQKIKDIYSVLYKLFPRVFKWQEEILVQADKFGFLQTPYGARRWSFAATRVQYDKFGKTQVVKKGEQAEEVYAYPTSCNSHYHMRESMIVIHDNDYDDKYNLVNMLHDQLTFMPKVEEWKECVATVVPIMERKSTVLSNEIMPEGFWCKVDGEVGKNMKDMEKI